jgi:hypothetical protein
MQTGFNNSMMEIRFGSLFLRNPKNVSPNIGWTFDLALTDLNPARAFIPRS